MKNLLLCGALLLFATGAFAQKKSSDLDTRFGIRGGLALASYSGKGIYASPYHNNPGFFATFFTDLAVSKNIIIQPGLSFQQKGTKLEADGVLGSTFATASLQQNIMQIEVPINAIFSINTGSFGAIQINLGPYVGYNFYGKNKNEGNFISSYGKYYTGGSTEIAFGNKSIDDLRNLDYGVNGGLSFKMSEGLLFGGNFGYGLANLVPNPTTNNKLQNRVLSFSIGYAF